MRRFALLAVALISAGCSRHPQVADAPQASRAPLRAMPGWYKKPPKSDAEWAFAPATATSRDVQIALDKASAEGRLALASQMEIKYSALTRRFSEETGIARDASLLDEFERTYKGVVSQVLIGSRAREQQFDLEDGVYRAWVLMELPIGEANKRLIEQLKAQEQFVTRVRATEAWKELNAEVERYDAAKSSRRP
jgi:hypothetical protein